MKNEPKNKLHKSSLLVCSSQLNNPIANPKSLKHEIYNKMSFDYFLSGVSTGIVFLSLEYHYQNPIYINSRIEELKKSIEFKETQTNLICVVLDRDDSNDFLVDLQMLKIEIGAQCILFKSGRHFMFFLKALLKMPAKGFSYTFY